MRPHCSTLRAGSRCSPILGSQRAPATAVALPTCGLLFLPFALVGARELWHSVVTANLAQQMHLDRQDALTWASAWMRAWGAPPSALAAPGFALAALALLVALW